MQKIVLLFLFIVIALGSSAHKGVFMGKIVDAQGKPVSRAEFMAFRDYIDYHGKVTSDGLYYTDSLLEGDYLIFIIANNINYKAKVKLSSGNGHKFYNFKLVKEKAVLTIESSDPFMEKALEKAKKEPATIIY